MINKSLEGNFLCKLFNKLNTSNINYAVMRNHLSLPYSAGGSDVDILVTSSDMKAAERLLLEIVEVVDAKVIGVVRTWNFFEAYIVGFNDDKWWGVCIEFYSDVAFKSTVPLIGGNLFKYIEFHNGVRVIPSDIGNAIGFIKEIFAHNKLRKDKPQYEKSIYFLLTENVEVFKDVFSPLRGDAYSLLLKVFLSKTMEESIRRIKIFRYSMILSKFFQNPLFFSYKRLRHEFFRFRRFIRPPGVVIAILGVDGVGKSTIINSILPALKAATHNSVFVQHLRPDLLPPLVRLKGKKKIPIDSVVDPHGSKPSGMLGSMFRLTYLTVDYVFGYWLKIRPRIAKQPTVVIFDRYAYDMVLDSRRFRIALPQKVISWFAGLAPKPDLIFCLHGDPEIIYIRKKELPIEETRRQIDALRVFAAQESRAVLIATDIGVEEARDLVLHNLCDFLQKRSHSLFL